MHSTDKLNNSTFLNIPNEREVIHGNKHLLYDWHSASREWGQFIRLVPDSEIAEFCENEHVLVESIPSLSVDSHECVWNNFKRGDYVEIEHSTLGPSGMTGKYLHVE